MPGGDHTGPRPASLTPTELSLGSSTVISSASALADPGARRRTSARPTRRARRFGVSIAVLAMGLALLPGAQARAADSPPPPGSPLTADDNSATVTWEVLPKQQDGQPFRSNFSVELSPGQELH